MDLADSYRRTWLMVTLFTWGFLLVVYAVLFLSVFLSPWIVALEVVHHLSFLSPFLAWHVARNDVEESTREMRDGGWLLLRSPSLWPLALTFGYAAVTAVLQPNFSLLIVGRILFSAFWLAKCVESSGAVAVLRAEKKEGGTRALKIESFDGSAWVTLKDIDLSTRKITLSEDSSSVPWLGFGPIEKLQGYKQ
jgi:hypothetical protein